MSLDLAAATRVADAADAEDGARTDQKIPWYIIDPTGDVIRKQRRMAARKEAYDKLEKQKAALSEEQKAEIAKREASARRREEEQLLEDARQRRAAMRMQEMAEEARLKQKEEQRLRDLNRVPPWYSPWSASP